jgi:hypothetical protein
VDFARDHPALTTAGTADTMAQDELSVLTAGTPMGRVFRVLSDTPLYDMPNLTSRTVGRVKAGALIVVFDNPGKFRQVLTHDETFGYMPAGIKLLKVDMLPAEIHDPAARAAVLAVPLPSPDAVNEPKPQNAASGGLTTTQIAITAALGIVVFAGIFLAMLKFGGN